MLCDASGELPLHPSVSCKKHERSCFVFRREFKRGAATALAAPMRRAAIGGVAHHLSSDDSVKVSVCFAQSLDAAGVATQHGALQRCLQTWRAGHYDTFADP